MSSLQIRKDRNRFPSKFFSPYFQLSKSRSSFPLIPNPESLPHRSHQFNSIPSRWTPPSLSSVPPAMQPSRRAALFAGGWSRRRSFLTSHQSPSKRTTKRTNAMRITPTLRITRRGRSPRLKPLLEKKLPR